MAKPSRAGLTPQVTLIAAAAVAVAAFAFAGVRAWRVDKARQQELQRAESALASFSELRRRYVPAVAAESIAWRRAMLEVQELGVGTADRLALTQRLTRSAEDAGLTGVRVHVEAPDTVGRDARLTTEGVQSKPAQYSLRVECSGGLESVIAFLGQLPPSVAPTRLNLVRQDGRGPHRISLAVYEITFTNGVPSGWSSLERSSAGTDRRGRPGG